MPSCAHIAPRPCHGAMQTQFGGPTKGSGDVLKVGANPVLQNQHPHPKASPKEIKGLGTTSLQLLGAVLEPTLLPAPSPSCCCFRWVLIRLRARTESTSAPAAVATMPSCCCVYLSKKGTDLPLEGI